jgi:hypothetical protein
MLRSYSYTSASSTIRCSAEGTITVAGSATVESEFEVGAAFIVRFRVPFFWRLAGRWLETEDARMVAGRLTDFSVVFGVFFVHLQLRFPQGASVLAADQQL